MRFLSVLRSRQGKPLGDEAMRLPLEKLCEKYEILLLYLFGSYATGNATSLSDLDLAYVAEKKLDPSRLLAFLGELQDLFEEEAVDLVDLRKAPLPLAHRVFKEGRCLYIREQKTKIAFETRIEALYCDTEPLRRESFNALLRRIEDGSFGDR